MKPAHQAEGMTVWHGDNLQLLRAGAELGFDYELGYEEHRLFPDSSVDAVVTDPPYGLGFMGHKWDQPGKHGALRSNGRPARTRREASFDHTKSTLRDGAMEAGRYDLSRSANVRFGQWCEEWAAECLRVLKPGGYLVAFGGSRTWHRLQCAVEDAGFEIRDSIAWLYGSGFPKSLDVSKAIDKAAGAERAVVGVHHRHGGGSAESGSMSGLLGTASVLPLTAPATDQSRTWQGWGTALKPAFEPIIVARKPLQGTVAANVQQHGTGALNIDACRVATSDVLTGSGTPPLQYGGANSRPFHAEAEPRGVTQHDAGRWPTNVVLDESQAAELDRQTGDRPAGRTPATRSGLGFGSTSQGTVGERVGWGAGGASRFFPVFRYEAKAPASERPAGANGTAHPTVKPLDLMRWLVRLVTRPGGRVLDLFAGTGTTGEACVLEGMECVLIEREADYLPLIVQRLAKPMQVGLFSEGIG